MARAEYLKAVTAKMERQSKSIEELLKFTLESHINQTLEFNLGLSKDFCINLLKEDPDDMSWHSKPTPTDSFHGVAHYPLYKRLASALYQSVKSGAVCRTYEKMVFSDKDSNLKQKEENWDQLIKGKGLELINVLEGISCEIHVQEPYFSLLKDGRKTIEGRCATDDYIRMFADMLHFRRCCKLRVSRKSFLELKLLRKVSRFIGSFIQKKRKCAMVSSQSVFQNWVPSHTFLWLAYCLNLVMEVFKVYWVLQILVEQFLMPYLPQDQSFSHPSFCLIIQIALTCGARALAKHAERSSDRYWGILGGSDSTKNRLAMNVISRLIASCRWSNIHVVPQHGAVFEIRVADGYGARWSKDGTKFIGFLEPHIEDGHSRGWKH